MRLIYSIESLAKDASGNVILLFGLASFTLLAAVGVGLETARYSVARTKVQYALDLAVLSAAAVRETQDYHKVGNDFFALNYPSEFMNTEFTSTGVGGPVILDWDPASQTMSGSVAGSIKTIMGNFVGLDQLGLNHYAEVIEEGYSNSRTAEIVLTIDNSASMCQTSSLFGAATPDPSCAKMNAVKNATRAFVTDLYDEQEENIYVGVVPFSHNVRMDNKHPLLTASHNAVWVVDGMPAQLSSIVQAPVQRILDLTNNSSALINYLSNMQTTPSAWAFTRSNVGVLAAGLMLMPYPEDRQYFSPPAGLPRDFSPRVDKILVLLTDGENIPHVTGQPTAKIPHRSDIDNEHLVSTCNLLKSHYGVTIYSVTYDLPGTIGSNPIKRFFHDCASKSELYDGNSGSESPFYFDTSSETELELTYKLIAESIKSIRLYK